LQQRKQRNSLMIAVVFMIPFSLVFYLLRIGFMAALVVVVAVAEIGLTINHYYHVQ
jgi:hypothetical protein